MMDGCSIRSSPIDAFCHGGAPCFPGAYDDTFARTPDLRDPLLTPTVGPHPRRVMLHVRPPFGFFEPSLREVALPAGSNPLKLDLSGGPIERLGPGEVLKRLGEPLDERGELVTPPPDKIVITGNLLVPAAARVEFEDLLFRDRLVLEPGSEEASVQVRLKRCAVGSLELPPGRDRPSVEAFDCLLGEIVSAAGFAQLVYCTLLSDTQLERLWASDCIFAGRLIDVKCSRGESCIRYSRVSDLARSPAVPSRTARISFSKNRTSFVSTSRMPRAAGCVRRGSENPVPGSSTSAPRRPTRRGGGRRGDGGHASSSSRRLRGGTTQLPTSCRSVSSSPSATTRVLRIRLPGWPRKGCCHEALISRDSHRPDQRYSGVYHIQGAMITDADLDERSAISRDAIDNLGRDAVAEGGPARGGAVRILEDGRPFLGEGVIYARGVRGDLAAAEGATLGGPLDIFTQQADLPLGPSLPTDGDFILYADIWERPVFPLEDAYLADVGLHGAVTAFRMRRMTQIKAAPASARTDIEAGRAPSRRSGPRIFP